MHDGCTGKFEANARDQTSMGGVTGPVRIHMAKGWSKNVMDEQVRWVHVGFFPPRMAVVHHDLWWHRGKRKAETSWMSKSEGCTLGFSHQWELSIIVLWHGGKKVALNKDKARGVLKS